ncbi:hypothetical protein A3F06_04010 [candidate division TM6 bacterium RIFCSPHIGHO2_12_FULL_36_22]|nr:MAG: hypothetical protein A3F06_04010 [candidate division TM6 bacterium RIFCSPHIGHO2_12_FULL_36_22]
MKKIIIITGILCLAGSISIESGQRTSTQDMRQSILNERLMSAILSNKKVDIQPLIKAGADPNVYNQDGNTVLMLAILHGNFELVRILIAARGIALNRQNNKGDTALMLAILRDNLDIVSTLIRVKTRLNTQNNDGNTALMLAVLRGNLVLIRLLIGTRGLALNIQNNDGNTALMLASLQGRVDVVKVLMAAGAR